jgi:hypothetical protein
VAGSPEHGLSNDAGTWSSLWLHQNGEGSSPVLTDGSDERWRGCDEPVMRWNKTAAVKLNGESHLEGGE